MPPLNLKKRLVGDRFQDYVKNWFVRNQTKRYMNMANDDCHNTDSENQQAGGTVCQAIHDTTVISRFS